MRLYSYDVTATKCIEDVHIPAAINSDSYRASYTNPALLFGQDLKRMIDPIVRVDLEGRPGMVRMERLTTPSPRAQLYLIASALKLKEGGISSSIEILRI